MTKNWLFSAFEENKNLPLFLGAHFKGATLQAFSIQGSKKTKMTEKLHKKWLKFENFRFNLKLMLNLNILEIIYKIAIIFWTIEAFAV